MLSFPRIYLALVILHITGPSWPLARALFFRDASWNFQKRLQHKKHQAQDRFGRAVALNGDFLAIGADGVDNHGVPRTGAVLLFQQTAHFLLPWHQEKRDNTLQAPNANINDQFGSAVAVQGTTVVVVGAPQRDALDGADIGAVYVYQMERQRRLLFFHQSVWNLQATIRSSNGRSGDNFGSSVAVEEKTLVVGARFHDNIVNTTISEEDTGAVYVFEQQPNQEWQEMTRLQASDAQANDLFGQAVAMFNDTIVVGARGKDSSSGDGNSTALNDNVGATYVFQKQGISWVEQQILVPMNQTENSGFGAAVATDDNVIVVGAFREGDNGAVYVFEKKNGSWEQQDRLVASDGDAGDQFGSAVAIDSGRIVVGAYLDNQFEQENVGAAYVFRKTATGWVQEQKLSACDKGPGDGFGFAVDISGDQIVVGAFARDKRHHGENSGAAYVFQYDKKSRHIHQWACRHSSEK